MSKESFDVTSFGTVYLDVDFLNFPFVDGIFAHRDTVGNKYVMELGGSAFNFAKICANLDLNVSFVGKIGDDQIGNVLKVMAKKYKVNARFIESPGSQTNLAVHYVRDDGTSIMTSAGSANQSLSPKDLESIVHNELHETKYLYLGGGLKLLELLPAYPDLVKIAKNNGVRIVLDHGRVTNVVNEKHKKIIQEIIEDVDIYLPSRDEFLDLWGWKTVEEGLSVLATKMNGVVVVKDAENGCYTINDGQIISVQPVPVVPINTIGAGDSFNAGFIMADNHGPDSLIHKMQVASVCAGIKISTDHLPSLSEIKRLHSHYY